MAAGRHAPEQQLELLALTANDLLQAFEQAKRHRWRLGGGSREPGSAGAGAGAEELIGQGV
ncbi:MAG: hypothetical protein HY901_22345 [Deltaproteobacteria bacterium]|nr:hypothetical protein [Deltaproteobacteria bacterium]